MGRQIKSKTKVSDWAYIAGFLDGDGSIMVQIKDRKDTLRGWRLGFTICLYQDTRHEKPLFWIREKLGIGYISHRNDNITELRVEGYKEVKRILEKLLPYVKFKRKQVKFTLRILRIVKDKILSEIRRSDRIKIVDLISKIRNENYQSGWKKPAKLKEKFKKLLSY